MAARHHQLQSVRFEEKKNNPGAPRNAKLKRIVTQAAQTKAGVGMRLAKSLDESQEALIDFLQVGVGAMPGPPFPACAQFNDEGFWRFRPTVWFFHACPLY